MSAYASPLVSADLIWEVTRSNNSFYVKRMPSSAGGANFSRDPLNAAGIHSRKNAGYVNDKAIGVIASEKGGVKLITKNAKKVQQPKAQYHTVTFGGNKSNRQTSAAIASRVAKHHYRPDLRASAVARASAIRKSYLAKKATPERKPRGNKAKKAEVEA